MLSHQFTHLAVPIREVKELQFGILSPCVLPFSPPVYPTYIHPHVTESHFCRQIEHPKVMDEATHKSKMTGLMDPRMGTMTGISSAKHVVKECQNALAILGA
jgi:DNA-directed RNA polymerase II subunit RPB1